MDTMGTLDLDPSTFYVRNNIIFNVTPSKDFKKLYHNFINKVLHLARFFYFKVQQDQHTTNIQNLRYSSISAMFSHPVGTRGPGRSWSPDQLKPTNHGCFTISSNPLDESFADAIL